MSRTLTSKEIVRRLILYAEYKKKVEDLSPGSYESGLTLSSINRLRKELAREGIDEELLDMSGHELEVRIYEGITSQLRGRI